MAPATSAVTQRKRSPGRASIVVLDNLVAGHREAVKLDGEFVKGDILDTAAVRAAMASHRVSAVMHFAAFLDVGESVREPTRHYRKTTSSAP